MQTVNTIYQELFTFCLPISIIYLKCINRLRMQGFYKHVFIITGISKPDLWHIYRQENAINA